MAKQSIDNAAHDAAPGLRSALAEPSVPRMFSLPVLDGTTTRDVAYDVTTPARSNGVTVICVPGLGDCRGEYRFLRPLLLDHGCTVVCTDLRGFGGSSIGFSSYTPDDTGRDVVQLATHLARERVCACDRIVLIGCSMAAASVTYAAAELARVEGVRVAGLVMLGAFAWDHPMPWYMSVPLNVMLRRWMGGAYTWSSFVRSLYTVQPTPVPDLEVYLDALRAHASEPGRIDVVRQHVFARKAACAERIPEVRDARLRVHAIYGERDPDFKDIPAECGELSNRYGGGINPNVTTSIVPAAGHYPHVESPAECMRTLQPLLDAAAQL